MDEDERFFYKMYHKERYDICQGGNGKLKKKKKKVNWDLIFSCVISCIFIAMAILLCILGIILIIKK